MLQMPAECVVLQEEEMTYLEGGGAYNVFTFLIGDWLRDVALGELRGAIYQSACDMSFDPIVNWFTAFPKRSLGSIFMFFVGAAVTAKCVVYYWKL